MRLSRTAQQITSLNLQEGSIILDVGGFDGSLALFLSPNNYSSMGVDPATTGASGRDLPVESKSFDVVVSIDALEHVRQEEREKLLTELVRVTRKTLLINFPEARSTPAQEIALQLTSNQFIHEHVNYKLPTREETVALLNKIAPKVSLSSVTAHTEIATWLPWYIILFQNDQEHGLLVSNFLKKETQYQQSKTTKDNENDNIYLYDLLVFDCANN